MKKHKPVAAVVLALVASLALSACEDSGSKSDKPASSTDKKAKSKKQAPKPEYKVTARDRVSGSPSIIVEVDTDKGLKNVFKYVATHELKEAGQHEIRIACSTGGTKTMLNLLAYGNFTPNLWDGDLKLKEGSGSFTEQDGAHCPAK